MGIISVVEYNALYIVWLDCQDSDFGGVTDEVSGAGGRLNIGLNMYTPLAMPTATATASCVRGILVRIIMPSALQTSACRVL